MNTNKTNATINQSPELNFQHFLPDFVNQELKTLKLFTIDELQKFGKANLEVLRQYHRKWERKIVDNLDIKLKIMFCVLGSSESIDMFNKVVSIREMKTQSKKELEEWRRNGGGHTRMCGWKSFGENCLSCQYGPFVAMWCQMNPQTSYGYSPFIPLKEQMDDTLLRQEYPFSDQPCLLTTNEDLESCKEFLQTQEKVLKKKVKLVRQRIDCLTKAIDLAEEKPVFTNWRDPEKWAKNGDEVIVYYIDETTHNERFEKAFVINTDFNPIAPGFRTDNLLVALPKVQMSFSALYPTIYLQEEFEYLCKHEDYLSFWLDWSQDLNVAAMDLKPRLMRLFREHNLSSSSSEV